MHTCGETFFLFSNLDHHDLHDCDIFSLFFLFFGANITGLNGRKNKRKSVLEIKKMLYIYI